MGSVLPRERIFDHAPLTLPIFFQKKLQINVGRLLRFLGLPLRLVKSMGPSAAAGQTALQPHVQILTFVTYEHHVYNS